MRDKPTKPTRTPVAALAKEIDRDLRAIRQIQRRPIEAEIARGGLTGPQQSAMRVLVQSGGISLKALSKELGLAHSTVSGIVDRLEKQGFVKRQSDEADLRFRKIVVTDLVRDFLRETWPSLEMNPLAEALRSATPAERQQILDGVRALRRILDRRNQPPRS
jgi:DNA-binding MarR family transcriptional regulator